MIQHDKIAFKYPLINNIKTFHSSCSNNNKNDIIWECEKEALQFSIYLPSSIYNFSKLLLKMNLFDEMHSYYILHNFLSYLLNKYLKYFPCRAKDHK